MKDHVALASTDRMLLDVLSGSLSSDGRRLSANGCCRLGS